jgi:anti-sigma B factor antagonist
LQGTREGGTPAVPEYGDASMAEEAPRLQIQDRGAITEAAFLDRKILDEANIQQIGDELNRIVQGTPGIRLLLNFTRVDHLSSAALGMLITLNKRVAEQRGTLKLCDIHPKIYEVFVITKLNKLFDIHEHAPQAIASFGHA